MSCNEMMVRVRLPSLGVESEIPAPELGGTWTEISRQTSTVQVGNATVQRIDRITFNAGPLGNVTLVLNNPN